jgi:diguanylate cyclase (GGDEF)-like protein
MIPSKRDPEGDQTLSDLDQCNADCDEVDSDSGQNGSALTGAWRCAPGLADMQREIHRANRGNGRLIVAYVDVEGLKATNDSRGHLAGNLILQQIVNVLQTNLRSCESVVRVGKGKFACTISDATIEDVRQRFDEVIAQLSLTPPDGPISVGFAELVRGDSPMDLIDRADRRLIASRETQSRNRRTGA